MKKQAKKEEIVKKSAASEVVSIVPSAPDYLEALAGQGQIVAGEGFEEVRPSDVKVPRIKIAQPLSPEAQEGPDQIQGLKQGMFFHTLTGDVYGSTITFIPLLKFGNRLLFKNMDEGGGILCRSMDMKTGDGEPGGSCISCPLSRFGSARDGQGKGTACNEFMNFPVLVVTEDGLSETAILSFKSTHLDAAKDLIGKARMRRLKDKSQAPMWSGLYKATTELIVDGKLRWYVPKIENAGWVSAKDVPVAKAAYDFMHQLREEGRLTTDQETLEASGD